MPYKEKRMPEKRYYEEEEMSKNDDYVKPPGKSVFKKAAGKRKSPYSYLHPDYRMRILVQLIAVAPAILICDAMICTWLILPHIPGMPPVMNGIIIILLTIVSAYFYPFSYWWYKKLNAEDTPYNTIYIVTNSDALLYERIISLLVTFFMAGVLAPITGPLTLRKCRKNNMIIGEECDFR
ncbi:MAG: hypothetical protein NC489_35250 [Ruminococcus flavefaciens]|nr:hypothetical protein [Ruminococcus flavefaciens]